MKTIPLNSAPYTAELYLRKCEIRKNRKACEWIDFREAAFRGGCYVIAVTSIATATGGLIASLLKF